MDGSGQALGERIVVLCGEELPQAAACARELGLAWLQRGSAYEAAAELLAAPAAALVVDLSALPARHLRLLQVAREAEAQVLAVGELPAGVDSGQLAGVQLVARRELPLALRQLVLPQTLRPVATAGESADELLGGPAEDEPLDEPATNDPPDELLEDEPQEDARSAAESIAAPPPRAAKAATAPRMTQPEAEPQEADEEAPPARADKPAARPISRPQKPEARQPADPQTKYDAPPSQVLGHAANLLTPEELAALLDNHP